MTPLTGQAQRDTSLDLAGLGAALGSGAAYGVTIVVGRSLARDGLAGGPVLGIRFTLGALVLAAFCAWRGRPVHAVPGERLRVVFLGVLYAVESRLFFAALGRGTAAAVTLIAYAYPAFVAVIELAVRELKLSARLVAALALSTGGVVLVVLTEAELSITSAGVAFALGAALTFTAYLLAGDRLVRATDPAVRAVWASAVAGLTLATVSSASGSDWPPASRSGQLVIYGLATAAAFGLMFTALGRIGPTRTAIALNFEVVSSVVLAALLLGEAFGPTEVLAGVAVIGGAALATSAPAGAAATPRASLSRAATRRRE